MTRLLLIDAYAMIYRAYYAFIRAPRMTSKGENTSAVFGFLTTLEDLKKRINPDLLGVAFDPHGPTFRHEAFEAYKAQREETPEDIRRAVPIIKQILQAMHIPILEAPGFEADDVIGTLAKKGEEAGLEVYMATPDKDYGQLVTEHIHQFRPRHTGGWDDMQPAAVCEKYGLERTEQVIDLLALMGDASDNIPGCKGVGEKTAVKLLQDYGSVEGIIQNADEIKGALGEKIRSQVDNIRFSYFLATIRQDVPISLDTSLLKFQEPDMDALTPLYEQLEFHSLLRSKRSAVPTPVKKKTPSAQLDLFQSDLFASSDEVASSEQPQFDTIENRLVSYLLNPEASFNPFEAPNFAALKADESLFRLYNEVELPLIPVLQQMQEAGVRFDLPVLRQAETQMQHELQNLESDIINLAGSDININSPKQVGELLFETLRLDPKAKKTKSGQYITSEEVLQSLKSSHPIVGKILAYRELKKLLSTYISPLPAYINPATGKIHATYNQTVTATGRLSCSNPNLQNLPVRSERGKLIRQAVIPDPGCLFLSADYSQIELRLLAHFSQDKNLLAAFHEGHDVHAATASTIFHVPLSEVTRDQRRKAKTTNFGIIYGISAFGLSQQLECSRSEAKQLIDDYFQGLPQVIQFIEHQKQLAREKGYAVTLFGRKRYLPDILSHNAVVRGFAERNAVNAPIQGTAADIIKKAMVTIARRLKEEGLKAQMIMQVHDELNFNVPEPEVDRVREIVVYEMEHVVDLSVPLIADCGVGPNWLAAH